MMPLGVHTEQLAQVSPATTEEPLQPYSFAPLPATGGLSPDMPTVISIPVVNDPRALSRLLEAVIYRAGQTPAQVAKDLGIRPQTILQYTSGRSTVGFRFFLKVLTHCGWVLKVERKK